MGLLNFVLSAPRMEHIKMAYVGRYVYQNIQNAEMKTKLYWHANEQANYFVNSSNKFDLYYLENQTMRTQYVALALSMMQLGISHGLQNYQWYFVKKPFVVEYYDDDLWHLSKKSLMIKSGIDVEFIPKNLKGSEVKKPI